MDNSFFIMDGFSIFNRGNDYFLDINNKKGCVNLKIEKNIFIKFRDNLNKPTSFEIEKKFLLKNIPDLNLSIANHDIEQFYLLNDSVSKSSVRIRKYDDIFLFTFKKGSGLSRVEIEFEILKEDFLNFDKIKISRNTIKKTRFEFNIDSGLVAEVDFFSGKFKDNILCEVEFLTEEDANNFIPPNWFGKDVSNDKKYGNIFMAFYL